MSTKDEESDSASQTQGEASTRPLPASIKIIGTYSSGDSAELRMEASRRETDSAISSTEIRKAIEAATRAVASPPSVDWLENYTATQFTDDAASVLFTTMHIRGFRTEPLHRDLLLKIKTDSLTEDGLWKYNTLLSEVFRKAGELSLALEFANKAIANCRHLGDKDREVISMTERGLILSLLDHPDTESYHREIVSFHTNNKLNAGLQWVYRNWGTFLWQKGQYNDALLLYREETEHRRKEGVSALMKHLFFLASRETDPSRVPPLLSESYELLRSLDEECTPGERARAYYTLASLLHLNARSETPKTIELATKGYELAVDSIGYEICALGCAGLLISCHSQLAQIEQAQKYEQARDQLLLGLQGHRETTRLKLASLLDDPDAIEDVRGIEQLVMLSSDKGLLLDWSSVMAIHLMSRKQFHEALSTCEHSLQEINEQTALRLGLHAEFSTVISIMADCHLHLGNVNDSVPFLETAARHAPNDLDLLWRLCLAAAMAGHASLAQEAAEKYITIDPKEPGPYRIASRARAAQGQVDIALVLLDKARKMFPDHKDIATEHSELSRIKLGIVPPEQSKFLKPFRRNAQPFAPPQRAVGLREYRTLNEFRRRNIGHIRNYIYQVQKTPPPFQTAFRLETAAEPKEEFYRDDFERMLSFTEKIIGSEIKHGDGRADIVVRPNSESLDSIIGEFKIWGRNDYKDSVSQLLGYATDFQALGVVFMINLNRKSIEERYRSLIIFDHPTYVVGSFRNRPVDTDSEGFEHFYSQHRTVTGRAFGVFHFILNAFSGTRE